MEEAIQSTRNGDNYLPLLTLRKLERLSSAGRMVTEHRQDLQVSCAAQLLIFQLSPSNGQGTAGRSVPREAPGSQLSATSLSLSLKTNRFSLKSTYLSELNRFSWGQ